jgi:hypothetical protein
MTPHNKDGRAYEDMCTRMEAAQLGLVDPAPFKARISELEARAELLTTMITCFVPLDYIWRDKSIKEHLQDLRP